MLSLACTLAAESSPPSGASAVFSASATSASILTEPLPVNDLPRVKDLACFSSATSSDTKETAGDIMLLEPRSSAAWPSATEPLLPLPASVVRLLLEPKKLPTLSSIDPLGLFLRSPAVEARTLPRDVLSPPTDMRTDMPLPPPAATCEVTGGVKGV